MTIVEAHFFQKLLQRAVQIVNTRLQSFDPRELRLYSKTLLRLTGTLGETAENHAAKEAFVLALQKELLNAAKYPAGKPLLYLRRVSDLTLTPYGSTVMGTSLRHGDVDISLDGHYQIRHSTTKKALHTIDKKELRSCLLYDVLKFLQFRNRLRMATPAFVLGRARIPILRCTDRMHGFQCDFSVGSHSGILRSRVLGEVIRQRPIVRDLVLLIKKWSKAHDLNDASKGSFSSYPLTIIVLTFCRQQGLIPSLDALVGDAIDSDLDAYCTKVRNRVKNEKTRQDPSLLELALSCFTFLSLYCSREALYGGQAPRIAVCCRRGIVQRIPAKGGRRSGVCVYDPFDLTANCAKPVTATALHLASRTLEQHLIQILTFLTCPMEERQQQWQSLFQSLFGVTLNFKQRSEQHVQHSSVRSASPARETGLDVLYHDLIDHYFQREDAKGVFPVRRDAHDAPFLAQYDLQLSQRKKCAEKGGFLPEAESLFGISSGGGMKDGDGSLAVPAT